MIRYDVEYNTKQKKSVAMMCRTKEDKDLNFPDFYPSGQILNMCTKTKHLGHTINDEIIEWWWGHV